MIRLLIDGQEPLLLSNTSKLTLPSYDSSIKVDDGGYFKSSVRGTGYNKAKKQVKFTVSINSYEGDILEDVIVQISRLFTWNPRRKYELERQYNGNSYRMELTAPKYTLPEITQLRFMEVKIQFDCVNNYFVSSQMTKLIIEQEPYNSEDHNCEQDDDPEYPNICVYDDNIIENEDGTMFIDFDTIIDVPFQFECNIFMRKFEDKDFNLSFRLGEVDGNFLEINTVIPKEYVHNTLFTLTNTQASIGNYDLTSSIKGALPFVSGRIKMLLKVNTTYTDIAFLYQGGII